MLYYKKPGVTLNQMLDLQVAFRLPTKRQDDVQLVHISGLSTRIYDLHMLTIFDAFSSTPLPSIYAFRTPSALMNKLEGDRTKW